MMASMIQFGGCASRKTRPASIKSVRVATQVQGPALLEYLPGRQPSLESEVGTTGHPVVPIPTNVDKATFTANPSLGLRNPDFPANRIDTTPKVWSLHSSGVEGALWCGDASLIP